MCDRFAFWSYCLQATVWNQDADQRYLLNIG